jgi:error-prone DNA polymerase
VRIAGLVLVRQRPGTASGVIFMTLEDETGTANVIVWPKVFEQYRRIVLGARMVAVEGMMQQEQGVIHVIAQRLIDLTPELMTTITAGAPPHAASQNNAQSNTQSNWRHPRDVRVLPGGRNFH